MPVLVVDDEPAIRNVLRSLLELEGYEVHTAANGLEALSALEASDARLVLLDLVMPEMDGAEFLRELERTGQRERTAIIIMTAVGGAEQRAAEIGANDFVDKPFDVEKLLAKVVHWTTPAEPESALLV